MEVVVGYLERREREAVGASICMCGVGSERGGEEGREGGCVAVR